MEEAKTRYNTIRKEGNMGAKSLEVAEEKVEVFRKCMKEGGFEYWLGMAFPPKDQAPYGFCTTNMSKAQEAQVIGAYIVEDEELYEMIKQFVQDWIEAGEYGNN